MQPAFAHKTPIDEPAVLESCSRPARCGAVIPMEKDVQKAAESLDSLMGQGSLDRRARRELGKALLRMGFSQIDSLAKASDAKRMRLMCTLASALR